MAELHPPPLRVIRWEDPPPTARRGRSAATVSEQDDPWVPVAAELRTKRGEWGVIAELEVGGTASSLTTYVTRGRSPAWTPMGAYEATARKQGNVVAVYARYVGPELAS